MQPLPKMEVLKYKPEAECCKVDGYWYVFDSNGDSLGYGSTPHMAWLDAYIYLGLDA